MVRAAASWPNPHTTLFFLPPEDPYSPIRSSNSSPHGVISTSSLSEVVSLPLVCTVSKQISKLIPVYNCTPSRPAGRRAASAGGDGSRDARTGPGPTRTRCDTPPTARLRRGRPLTTGHVPSHLQMCSSSGATSRICRFRTEELRRPALTPWLLIWDSYAQS